MGHKISTLRFRGRLKPVPSYKSCLRRSPRYHLLTYNALERSGSRSCGPFTTTCAESRHRTDVLAAGLHETILQNLSKPCKTITHQDPYSDMSSKKEVGC